MKKLLVLPVLLSLASCGPTPQEMQQNRINQASYSCKAYGFKDGSNEMAQCIQAETQKMIQREQASYDALMRQGGEMYRNATQVPDQSIYTNCSQNGRQVTCITR